MPRTGAQRGTTAQHHHLSSWRAETKPSPRAFHETAQQTAACYRMAAHCSATHILASHTLGAPGTQLPTPHHFQQQRGGTPLPSETSSTGHVRWNSQTASHLPRTQRLSWFLSVHHPLPPVLLPTPALPSPQGNLLGLGQPNGFSFGF